MRSAPRLVAWQHHVTIAVDPARFGADASVAAICRGPTVERLVTWRGASITESEERVRALVTEYTVDPRHVHPKFPHLVGP
ncbi:MAG TPA: hypothetical protein VLN49_19900, partial [Gemmatimonadaceae bacterium]|nr:hypothetical protein [Gemmatimonadaceae bacterium]